RSPGRPAPGARRHGRAHGGDSAPRPPAVGNHRRRTGVRACRAVARCTPVEVVPAAPDWWRALGEPRAYPLDDADAVFMRVDPPFDAAYLRATYLLDRVDPSRTLVLNAPSGLR